MKILNLFNKIRPVLTAPGVSDRFAAELQDKNNPDHVILAYVLRSLVTEYPSWKFKDNDYKTWDEVFNVGPPAFKERSRSTGKSAGLELARADLSVKIAVNYRTCDYTNRAHELSVSALSVNDTPLNPDLGLKFALAVNAVREKQAALERASKQAKLEMEINEKKWNLVENVLGLKRLEDGTLVADG